MESNWVKIYTASSYVEAEIIRTRLVDEDIPCTLLNKQDSMHVHLNSNVPIDIFVAKDNAFKAVQIISNTEGELNE